MAGDAAGALLEGRTSIDDSTARKAIAMLPGGSRSDDVQLSPGQITDDGELMLMLLDGIATSAMEPSMGFPANEVASNYVAWYASRPFSCGQATHNAFGKYAYASSSISTEMKKVALAENETSESNGALMRCAPIACWARHAPLTTIMSHAREDARLSHPSQVCQDANAAFCVAVSRVILTGNGEKAASLVDELAEKGNFCAKVKEWLQDSRRMNDVEDYGVSQKAYTNAGHAKHAFTLAFVLLRRAGRMEHTFESALCEVMKLGGDVDTNACICGYVMGAMRGLHPYQGVSPYVLATLMRSEKYRTRYVRPRCLYASRMPTLLSEIP
jgi:ADP-ribosylglycohydrolase